MLFAQSLFSKLLVFFLVQDDKIANYGKKLL